MRRAAIVLAGLLCASLLARCGGSTVPSAPTRVPVVPPAPTVPLPRTYTVSGLTKEAWLNIGLGGVTVWTVSGPSFASTVSDSQGHYTLTNLAAGNYMIGASHAAPWGTFIQSLTVSQDTSFSPAVSLTGGFPVLASDLTGYWYGGGPFPNQPFFLTLVQNGTTLTGGYADRQNATYRVTGTYVGSDLHLRIDCDGLTLALDGKVEDPRNGHGNMWHSLKGNFPFTMQR